MARKRKEPDVTLPEEASGSDWLNAVRSQIEAEFGVGIMKSGQDIVDEPRMVIPFSPSFDEMLGGGVPEGSWVSMAGPEKCGKSVAALSFAAQCQMPEYGERPVMILAPEHRTDGFLLSGIRGLRKDESHLIVIQSEKGRILTSVDYFNIGLSFLKNVPGGVLLIDSVSAMLSPKVLQDGIESADHGSSYQLIGKFIDLAVPVVRCNRNIVFGIIQQYTNTRGYGGMVEKAAMKWKYQADIRVQCTKSEFLYDDGEDMPPTGQRQSWRCKKSALCGPGREVSGDIRFGVGIDTSRELLTRAAAQKLVSVNGSWYVLRGPGDEVIKVQGETAAVRLLDSRPDLVGVLRGGLR